MQYTQERGYLVIVFDLEWDQGCGGEPFHEILQIGAVRLSSLGGRISGTFNAYVRPTVHKKLSPQSKKLPDAALSLASCTDFSAAYADFLVWCGPDREFAAWGNQDLKVLGENAARWQLPAPPAECCLDLQAAFGRTVGADRQLSLEWAAAYCRIPDCFSFHNALHDALYAALSGAWIAPEALLSPCPAPDPAKGFSFSAASYPAQPRVKLGPFDTAEDLLNSRRTRRVPCPVCGQPCAISVWYPCHTRYFGGLSCPEHGLFPCRITLAQLADGSWRGRRAVPLLTEEVERTFRSALCNEPLRCRALRKRRRRKNGARPQQPATVRQRQ